MDGPSARIITFCEACPDDDHARKGKTFLPVWTNPHVEMLASFEST